MEVWMFDCGLEQKKEQRGKLQICSKSNRHENREQASCTERWDHI